ncbi:MAG: PLP-dependent transferase [Clostridia bacterium]|nr:PLP-dependent transferase [Clostridia bacterium]
MKTPICDFVRSYIDRQPLRLHMPGHKGETYPADITEIGGADSLYEASGIIRESEQNASTLFGGHTYYSTEGSSHAIRAMLYVTCVYANSRGEKPRVLAARNAHKTFVNAAALLDMDVEWFSGEGNSYLSCVSDMAAWEEVLCRVHPTAVYVTSPDYLGNTVDIAALAERCHRHGVLLLVDNAHGAYLKFLSPSRHPLDLGADLCCDSAHKTLPVLTGGAYLHIAKTADPLFAQQAKTALSLFGSTSPSYLILQSLDEANAYLADGYAEKLCVFSQKMAVFKRVLQQHGYALAGDEPLKVTLCPKSYGYTGVELANYLEQHHIVCEFADPDFLVMMFTPEQGEEVLCRVQTVLCALDKCEPIGDLPPVCALPARICSPREALFSPSETIAASQSEGRVLACATVGCPPAVPLIVCGEKIDHATVRAFAYYGIQTVQVIHK